VSDALAIEGAGLRVVFRRLGDRFAHRVELVEGSHSTSILESLEGEPDDPWPPSPPLQELHFEDRPAGRRLALLVGRAGASHWSLSVEWDPHSARFSFDVACRVRSAPERLGSRYRLPGAAAGSGPIDASAGVALPGGRRLRSEAVEDRPACKLIQQAGEIQLHPAAIAAPWPKTSRWQYSITAASDEIATEREVSGKLAGEPVK
jgi:hypothetical protein